jgi:hypothetical protein
VGEETVQGESIRSYAEALHELEDLPAGGDGGRERGRKGGEGGKEE